MSKITNTIILEKASEIFAYGGLGEFRIRLLAKKLGVVPSVIYHHFTNEEVLLKNMFDYLNSELGRKRSQLISLNNTSDMLKQRIEFQLDNATAIVAVLKYYLAFRKTFPKRKDGFVPDKSALHMEEVLRFAKSKGDYKRSTLKDDAKVMTHAVNGFLLEYYPHVLVRKEKTALIQKIHNFLFRALKGGEIK
jgi:AcrR family transcriptional regulator